MEYDFDGTTLEEGRIALQELENYLKEREEFPNDSGSVGKQSIKLEDRKLMDHVPRNERLRHIKGSPLGLTLEVISFSVLPYQYMHFILKFMYFFRSWMIAG